MLEMIDFSIRNTNPEKIGYKGENLAETLEILTDSGPVWSYTLEARMGCNAYSVAVMDYADGKITLPLTANILRMEGTHEAQIVANKGEVVKKSNIFFIRVGDAISAGQNLPGVEESIFNQQVSALTALVQSANDAKQEIADSAERAERAEQAAQRAEDGKTVAVDAAKRAEDSEVIASAEALSARASAIRAETFAQKAEEIVEGFSPEGGGSGGYNPPEGGIPLTDLSDDVQAALQKAETALQSFEEADPTVPEWARSESKPTYTAAEVGALPSDTPLFSGDYNDLENKPTIPEAITEQDVADWGFTKNAGTYSKPADGIPESDLSRGVKDALSKAETALQSFDESDPTVPAWAKSPTKPTYTAAEVGALPADALVVYSSVEEIEIPTMADLLSIDNKIGVIDSALQMMIDKAEGGLDNG